MMLKELKGAGLRGQVAGETALCTVGEAGIGLTYRGYGIDELAEHAQFEEVAFLLSRGRLPSLSELGAYMKRLKSLRGLPTALKKALESIPAEAHPMSVCRTGISLLGNLEEDAHFEEQDFHIDRMLAILPSIICYWYRYSHDGAHIDTETPDESIGGHFLHMLLGEEAKTLYKQVMNVSLILYAEHEFNASTFTARVCASTLSDIHSCIAAAIGALRGPLHGGANEKAMEMMEPFRDPDHAEQALLAMLQRKEKIMGFGHPVYRESDPRNEIIKKWARALADDAGDTLLYPIAERCEEVMKREKDLFCNADFFHAPAYRFMGIPTKLFTPIFAIARVTGWTAHVKEQRVHNRIIRPSAEYTGPLSRAWTPIADR